MTYPTTIKAASPSRYWRFNETSGTVAKDSSVAKKNGTYVGPVVLHGETPPSNGMTEGASAYCPGERAPAWDITVPTTNIALGVTGIGDGETALEYKAAATVKTTAVAPQNVEGTFSVEVWFNPSTTAQNSFLFTGREVSNENVFDLRYVGNAKQFHANISGEGKVLTEVNVSGEVTAATWNHLVFTVEPGKWFCYLNGVEKGTGTYSGTAVAFTNALHLWLGTLKGASFAYKGNLAKVAVYTTAMSLATAKEHFEAKTSATYDALIAASAGLLVYWPCKDVAKALTVGAYGPTSGYGYVTAEMPVQMESLECWIRPDSPLMGLSTNTTLPESDLIYNGEEGGVKEGYGLYLRNSGIRFFVGAGAGGSHTLSSEEYVIPPGCWSHIVATYSPTEKRMSLYLNGVLLATESGEAIPGEITFASITEAKQGVGRGIEHQPFQGAIAETAVYSTRALTAAEVLAHWEAAEAGVSAFSSHAAYQTAVLATAGLVNYWPLNETSGTTAHDRAGNMPGAFFATNGGTVTEGAASLFPGAALPAVPAPLSMECKLQGGVTLAEKPASWKEKLRKAMSVELWFIVTQTPQSNTFPAILFDLSDDLKVGGVTNAFTIVLRQDLKLSIQVLNEGSGARKTQNKLLLNTIYYVVCTFNGSLPETERSQVYLNTVKQATELEGAGTPPSEIGWSAGMGVPVRAGLSGSSFPIQGNSTFYSFFGRISDIAVYQGALTEPTIKTHYEAGLTQPELFTKVPETPLFAKVT